MLCAAHQFIDHTMSTAEIPIYIPRFVDHDMFMCFRGSGIGHKYMQAIKKAYENMSHKWTHHKEYNCKHAPSDKDMMDIDSMSVSENESKPEDHITTLGGSRDSKSNGSEGGHMDGSDEEEDYVLGSGSDSSEASNSDELVSKNDYKDESHGFGKF